MIRHRKRLNKLNKVERGVQPKNKAKSCQVERLNAISGLPLSAQNRSTVQPSSKTRLQSDYFKAKYPNKYRLNGGVQLRSTLFNQ